MQHANKHTPHIHTSYLLIYQINSTVAEQSTNWVEKLRAEQSTNWALKQSRGKGTCLHVMQIEHQSSRAPREQPRLDQRLGAERRRWGFHVQARPTALSLSLSFWIQASNREPRGGKYWRAPPCASSALSYTWFPRASFPTARPLFQLWPACAPSSNLARPLAQSSRGARLAAVGMPGPLSRRLTTPYAKNSWRPGRHKNFTAWMTRRRHKNHGMR